MSALVTYSCWLRAADPIEGLDFDGLDSVAVYHFAHDLFDSFSKSYLKLKQVL
jgi:hypothetical protein